MVAERSFVQVAVFAECFGGRDVAAVAVAVFDDDVVLELGSVLDLEAVVDINFARKRVDADLADAERLNGYVVGGFGVGGFLVDEVAYTHQTAAVLHILLKPLSYHVGCSLTLLDGHYFLDALDTAAYDFRIVHRFNSLFGKTSAHFFIPACRCLNCLVVVDVSKVAAGAGYEQAYEVLTVDSLELTGKLA